MTRFQSTRFRALTRAHAAAWLVALCVLLTCLPALAATTTVNLPGGRYQQFNPDTGGFLIGGKLQSYVCGTTTPTPTYADQTGTVANANPVILDGSGQASVWLDPAVCYKLVQKKSDDSVIWTLDNVNTPAAGVFTTLTISGAATFSSTISATQLISTIATGTPPIVVNSTTKAVGLNADQVDGGDWANPPASGYGSTTPEPVAATTVTGTTGTFTGATSALSYSCSNADCMSSGGKIVPTTETVPFYIFGTMVDTHVWIAPRAGQVVSIKEIHSVVGGASCAVRPRKITDTSAPGAVASATVKEITQANFDCTAAINTTQTGTLSATASDYTFAAGDKIAFDVSGTMTGLVGIIVMEWKAQ